MSAPTGEAPPPEAAAPAVPASPQAQAQTAPTPAATHTSPAQASAVAQHVAQQSIVSGSNVTEARQPAAVAQVVAQGHQGQAPQVGQTGAPTAGKGASAPRAPAAITRDTPSMRSLGPAVNSLVKKSRVLMVGAGGIGCELLKNIVLLGFSEIHVVDLDTIDLSNLNRQFLFRHEHIKKSKALVAKETAQKFNPRVKIEAHMANIKEAQFNVEWFSGFKIVFNALDNMEARRHVNKMCLAADVPLIESGTTGFNGQVQVIKKGVTACYDCSPKDAPKSFPVCTIRSTPSQPIHCIVWGKSYLLNEMFGASEDQSVLDHSADQENANEIKELKKESDALKAIRESSGSEEFPQLLFDKVFKADIERLRSMEDMWKSRQPPNPLDYKEVMAEASKLLESTSKDELLEDGQKVWSLEESLLVFNDSLNRLSKRMIELKKAHDNSAASPLIEFDKDDDDTLDFVASSANIRSTIFGIERKSRFDIKQMAGNIIPAIATTNAIVAGLCVLQAFKVLKGEYGKVKEVFLSPFTQALPARVITADRPRQPNPECPVCSVFQTSASIDLARATLKDLVDDFLRLQLGYGDKELSISTDAGILYDPDETGNLNKKLSELGIKPDTFVTVTDEDDTEPCVDVLLNVQQWKGEQTDKPVQGVSTEKLEIPKKPKSESQASKPDANQSNGTHKVDQASGTKLKRALEDDETEPSAKKPRLGGSEPKNDEVINVDGDGESGAILIDD
ncbi:unnamed protein product [Discula destructiva]